jgi:hypothetical protein
VVRLRSLETQQDDANRSVAAAQKNYDLSKEGYRRGLTDYLNVLVAQNQLLHAREGVARIQAQQLGAHASLMTALGGGLADPTDGPKPDETLPAHGRGKASTGVAVGSNAQEPTPATSVKTDAVPGTSANADSRVSTQTAARASAAASLPSLQ